MVLRLHILGAGNQKRHYTYVPWMLWLMLGIPKFCMSFHHNVTTQPCGDVGFLDLWGGRLGEWHCEVYHGSTLQKPGPGFLQHGWGLWLRVRGSMVVYPFHQKIPFDPKVRQKSDLMSDFFWKKSQDFNISTAVGHTETWLQLAVFGFGRHLAVPTKCGKTIRRSWSWRKSFGSDSMDQMCLDKAEDATDGPMEFQLWL